MIILTDKINLNTLSFDTLCNLIILFIAGLVLCRIDLPLIIPIFGPKICGARSTSCIVIGLSLI